MVADALTLNHADLDGVSVDDAAALSPQPASRHYRRARQDRGAETRQRLLLAALDAFGRFGFEGASTRDMAKRAEANLAAIVYHFGSKEALHRAVAEYVAQKMAAHTGASVAAAAAALKGPTPDRPTARRLLQQIVDDHLAAMLGESESELWGRFIRREQMEPSSAFDAIHDFIMHSQMTTTHLVAILLGLDPHSDEATLRAYAVDGQYLIFFIAQPIVLKRLGRQTLLPEDHEAVRAIVTRNIDVLVGETYTPEG
jgi:AcrR family transcriptional regulator